MTTRLVHYGIDECHRLTVLRARGFAVEDCDSLPQLSHALTAEHHTGAVLITQGERNPVESAVLLARSRCSAPVILFRQTTGEIDDRIFDLVVETLTSPQQWLDQLDALILECRSLSGGSEFGPEMSHQQGAVYQAFTGLP